MNIVVDFKSIKLYDQAPDHRTAIREISVKEIAIIGMSAKFPFADNIEAYWQNIASGLDCIGEFPNHRRQDTDSYLDYLGNVDRNYFRGAYLSEIDMFDYSFFRLSPKEASLMSPNQRLFLETAWNAIEDAGYGGKKLIGSKTGVYLGFEADAPYDYKRFIAELEPDSLSFAVPGNLTPIIASRLSYLLDLKGPSLSVDTACSSALVAIHLACQAIRNGECEMAVAGSIRLNLLPVVGQLQLGVESSDGRARSFDDGSDGTGSGEGVAAVILKPLNQAIRDRDHIYAVIKGSAVNQDGSSIGITAPNVLAQAEVIVSAWKDAGIDPETISCIEAHGTGTKLGDPIEIDGIQRAFRKFTTKKQFCAIGSVKTNIGHLDNAAGIAGLIKMVQALQAKKIPPMLHFNKPNHQINFEQSPVYINDRLTDWESNGPRRCGISSFGFSGTNCHLVLEEAPVSPTFSNGVTHQIMTLSAQNRTVLQSLCAAYQDLITREPYLNPGDLCYTVNTGRGHYNIRVAFHFENDAEFREQLARLAVLHTDESPQNGIYYGEHKLVPANKKHRETNEYTETELKEFSRQALEKTKQFINSRKIDREILAEICALYVQGADIDWEELYIGEVRNRIRLPGYPFERNRCWIKAGTSPAKEHHGRRTGWPMLDYRTAESLQFELYETFFSIEKHWVLNEHRIMGNGVLVGTAYLEMAAEAVRDRYNGGAIEFREVVFLAPLVLQDGEQRVAQLILKPEDGYFGFEVISRPIMTPGETPSWSRHVMGKLKPIAGPIPAGYDPMEIKSRYSEGYTEPDLTQYNDTTIFNLGPRWRNIKAMYVGAAELLSYLEMPADFTGELPGYFLYPSLLDNALATVPLLQNIFKYNPVGEGQRIFLPFSYHALQLYRPLPARFYSYVRLNGIPKETAELASFEISLFDINGNILAEIHDYCLKRVPTGQFANRSPVDGSLFSKVGWVPRENTEISPGVTAGAILIFKDGKGIGETLIKEWRKSDKTVFVAEWGPSFRQVNPNHYIIGGTANDYSNLLNELNGHPIGQIYFLPAIPDIAKPLPVTDPDQNREVKNLFYLARELAKQAPLTKLELLMMAEYVYNVTGREPVINPENAALFGLGLVIGQEYPNIHCKCIDIDDAIPMEKLKAEFQETSEPRRIVAFRDGVRYVREFQTVAPNDFPAGEFTLRNDGVYVITGGTGGIGLEIAGFLTSKQRINLALLNRSRFPGRQEWERILQDGTEPKLGAKIRRIQAMEAGGARISFHQVDVGQYDQLQKVIADLRTQYGRINGVIHSAGVAGDGFLFNKAETVFDDVLAPKIQGTRNLDELTAIDLPDFMVLCSSVTTLTGAPGQGDYTAANAFLDSFAAYRRKTGRRTLTINWAGWRETGMAVDHQVNQDGLFKTLMTATAVKAFEQVMNSDLTLIQIGELNYQALEGRSLPELGIYLADDVKARLGAVASKANQGMDRKIPGSPGTIRLKGRKAQEYSELEVKIAQVWGEVLGYEELNLYDNFYQLGGDSISMMKVISQMSETLNLEVSFRDFTEHNTINDLASHIARMGRPEKGPQKIVYPAKKPDPEHLHEPFPLTDVQMAYLIGRDERFEMSGISTHAYLEIETGLDMERFNDSLRRVIRRHPMLRAVIFPEGVQRILEQTPEYQMEIMDLRRLDQQAREAIIAKDRERMSHHVFQSDQWPLYEFKAFRLTDEINYLLIGFDVIIADAFSLQIIFKEILEYYYQPQLELPEIRFSFRDYLLSYQEFKGSPTYETSKKYWQRKLEDFPPAPVLPLLRDPAGLSKPRFKRLHKVFDATGWERLKKNAQNQNVTPSALLCTAYARTLAYWSNQPRLAINLTVFNRYPFHLDIHKIVGDFTSVILLGLELPPNTLFWEQAKLVQGVLMEALEHRHYDGVEFIRDIARHNNLGAKAVMPIVFTSMFFDKSVESDEPGIVKMGLTQTPQVYIDHQVTEKKGDLIVQWDYAEELFAEDQISAMFEQYTGIVANLIAGRDDYQLAPAATDLHFIEDYNRTGEPITPSTLDRLFAAQARLTPDRQAVVFETEQITYQQLHHRSNQIAHYLRKQGVGCGELVGVLARRSIATIVNTLGILKAGAAYVPIDPDYPEDRKNYIIHNSGCRLCLEPEIYDRENIAGFPSADIPADHSPGDLAYVIYTSGSTGQPKGVVITHGAVSNTIIDLNQKYRVDGGDRIMGISSMCFDLSVYDIFGALSAGACLVLVRDQRDIVNLVRTMGEKRVTIWNSVPAIMGMAVGVPEFQQKSSDLRLVLLSGDWIPIDLPDKIKKYSPGVAVISLGGATEASIWSIFHPIGEVRPDWKSIPYGRPLANQKFYVLNYELQLCPVNVPGELFIGGAGLALEYRGDETKTRNAFILHPQLGVLYRTGDYGVWRREGYIEFLGRKDHQIKIRGFRIELGEIESGLLRHPAVKGAVVIDRTDPHGKKYLCAYLVANQTLKNGDLREHLAKALPEYMIPAYFIYLYEIPLTPNGKVDRKQLPEPDYHKVSEETYLAPRNETEAKLVRIWQDVLGIDKVGVNDNFFELGGSSVQLIEMHTQIEKNYPGKLRITDLFAYANVEKLVELINRKDRISKLSPAPLPLPRDYFTGQTDSKEYLELHFEIKGALYEDLKGIAGQEGVTLPEVLFLIYVYLLAQLAGQPEIELPLMVKESGQINLARMKLTGIQDFKEFFKTLAEQQAAASYEVTNLNDITIRRQQNTAIPFYYQKGLLTRQVDLTQFFDIILEVNETSGQVSFICDYNAGRLHETKMKAFVANYLKLMKQMADRMTSVSKH